MPCPCLLRRPQIKCLHETGKARLGIQLAADCLSLLLMCSCPPMFTHPLLAAIPIYTYKLVLINQWNTVLQWNWICASVLCCNVLFKATPHPTGMNAFPLHLFPFFAPLPPPPHPPTPWCLTQACTLPRLAYVLHPHKDHDHKGQEWVMIPFWQFILVLRQTTPVEWVNCWIQYFGQIDWSKGCFVMLHPAT